MIKGNPAPRTQTNGTFAQKVAQQKKQGKMVGGMPAQVRPPYMLPQPVGVVRPCGPLRPMVGMFVAAQNGQDGLSLSPEALKLMGQ